MELKHCASSFPEPESGGISKSDINPQKPIQPPSGSTPATEYSMDPELEKIEAELERIAPGSMPEGLIGRMEAAMEGWQEAPEQDAAEKVVPFPLAEEESDVEESRGDGRGLWAAAASMALLGGVAAMIMTSDPSPLKVAEQDPGENSTGDSSVILVDPEALQTIELAPKTAKRTILDSTDRAVIIPNGSKPMRLMRVDLVDRVVFLSPDGEEVHLEVPSVNYQLIPVPTD